MSTKSLIGACVAVAFIGGGLGLALWNESRPDVAAPAVGAGSTDSVKPAPTATYTLTDVAAHDDADSCWTSIEGRVYDMTDYIEDHPGGAAPILAVCGQDGTEIFMTMPAAVIPVARMGIAPYKIGTLAP